MASSRSARAAPSAGPAYRPYFGVEIEIFVKLRDGLEQRLKDIHHDRYNGRAYQNLPAYYQQWNFTLSNAADNGSREIAEQKAKQRLCVGLAVEHLIKEVLGKNNGWACKPDASLREFEIKDAESRWKWWGIEIVSPAMSTSRPWRTEIESVFKAVGKEFEFWTHECCSTHVHVSPGPDKKTKYRLSDLVDKAKGAYLWEEALCELIEPKRRKSVWARPNHKVYAGLEYANVANYGWKVVFDELENAAMDGTERFLNRMRGGPVGTSDCTRYVSTSFHPTDRLGTVELRRQAGSASATTVIYRVLFAVTLHVSGLSYPYAKASDRRDHPTAQELIAELSYCMGQLPKTCSSTSFINWLRWCVARYAGGYQPSELETNVHEMKLRLGAVYPNVNLPARTRPQGPSIPDATSRDSPSGSRTITRPAPTPTHAASPPPSRPVAGIVRYDLPERPAPRRDSRDGRARSPPPPATQGRRAVSRPPPGSSSRAAPEARAQLIALDETRAGRSRRPLS
ncbi:uncharacterized protein B0T15DRAFT_398996 [Chaetomium strumarium]|uniref:Uncharacterized protein n=1 Tax=Chaetomium strumarium TaxID=1170767 RepID=A0AAJ0GQA8_9PEZI|nr:hypothetical protein B0T15DRAFT_398996 [Chaetomium strumarium]